MNLHTAYLLSKVGYILLSTVSFIVDLATADVVLDAFRGLSTWWPDPVIFIIAASFLTALSILIWNWQDEIRFRLFGKWKEVDNGK